VVPVTRKPAKRPVGIGEAMALLEAARARGLVTDEHFDLSLKLLLRRHGLAPATVAK
jgi:hypothetical protein